MNTALPNTRLLVFLSYLGISLAILFAFVSFWRGYTYLFFIKLGIASLYALNLVYLLRSKKTTAPCVIGFTLTVGMMVIAAKISGIYALFWIYVIPLLAFFLFGLRGGIVANVAALTVITISLFFHDSGLAGLQLAELDIALSYLVVMGMAFFYEKQKQEYATEVERISHVDPLTGAFNRRVLHAMLRREMQRAGRYTQPLSVIMMDIDRYKRINDRHGHKHGDHVLRNFAEIVRDNIRSSDCFVRYGGDEFIILAPNTDLNKAGHIADKIRRLVATHNFGRNRRATVSAGVAQCRCGEREEMFLHRADKALYRAKHRGRNRVITDNVIQIRSTEKNVTRVLRSSTATA